MAVRESRRSRPLCAKPAETLPEERLRLPRGYLIYALAAQTGLRDTGRRAAPGPSRPWRQSPSSKPRQYLVLVQVASLKYTEQNVEEDCYKKAQKTHNQFFLFVCLLCLFVAKTKLP